MWLPKLIAKDPNLPTKGNMFVWRAETINHWTLAPVVSEKALMWGL